MSNWLISSVQQYTLDRLRVSFSRDYAINELKSLTCQLFDSEMNDVSDKLKSIIDSNEWEYMGSSNVCDIILNKNTSLTEGNYTFKLFEKERLVYESNVRLNYMEDIRTTFKSVELISLDTLLIKFSSLYEDNLYQSREMLSMMNFSCIDESGVSYSDVFESFNSLIEKIPSSEEPITEIKIKLKSGRVLPKGFYTIRLTSRYKSRTFSILQSECKINFMTTTPPTITSSIITKKGNGDYVLSVAFGNYFEKSMMESATRLILRSDGKNVSSYFNADRISTTMISTAGVSYIVRLEIPLVSEFYVLQKGQYILVYDFSEEYINDISSDINTDWCLKEIESVELEKLKYLTFKFSNNLYYSRATEMKYFIEIDGEKTTDPETIDAFSDIRLEEKSEYDPDQVINKFYIDIKNKEHLKKGLYSFIFYFEGEDEPYQYIAYFNFKQELTPKVFNIYQSDIDTLTIELAKPLPIEVVEYCSMSLYDEYGNIDFSSRLESIHDSNIWEPGQETADRFNVMISGDSYLSSGKYMSSLIFGDIHSSKIAISLSYMEIRRGLIEDIIQDDLSHVNIKFTEPQTRKFLLTTELMVERKVDGADFTDRFELLENVIKADQYIISDFTLPLNHDKSLPEGIYQFSFIWKTSKTDYVTVYSFDVRLGYMTSRPPEISTTSTFIDSDGLLNLRINFGAYLENELFNRANISLLDSDDIDIISKMENKSKWLLIRVGKEDETSIKSITIKALDKSLKFEKDLYNIIFSWDGVIDYIEDIDAYLDIDYILPLTTVSEVVSLDTKKRTARMYFEFDQVLQYSFFESLKVEVFDENGQDQTNVFDTIQNSNNIGPDTPEESKVPTNNINLNILNINELTFGSYTFIFYHEKNGVRTSEYKSMLDIMAAISPSIDNMEQVGIDTLLINLKAAVPRMILESDSFTFVSFKKVNYTSYFDSIDSSNQWDEKVREVSSFYIKMKNGYKLGKGSYSFTMFADSLKLDQCDIELDYMEGANISVRDVHMENLSTLVMNFTAEQSTELYNTLELRIIDEDGKDVSYMFEPISEILKSIKAEYFTTIKIHILEGCSIPAGKYTFNIIKRNEVSEDTVVMNEIIPLKFMSSTYPLLYEVSATKIVDEKEGVVGNDGVIMTFIPELELDLFNNAGLAFSNISGMSVLDRFEPLSNAFVSTKVKDGITYVEYAILEFDPSKTLNKDRYKVDFNWIGDYSYMKNLSCEVSMDYILFPVKSVELISNDTVEIVFNKYLKKSYLLNTELVVKSIYTTTIETGTVVTEVDFTKQFEALSESNDFDNLPDDINKIKLTIKDGMILPNAKYRFIIAEKINDMGTPQLQYAYSGTLEINILISDDILASTIEVSKVSYDTLKIKFEKPQNVKFLKTTTFNIQKIDNDGNKTDFSSMFKSITQSNTFDKTQVTSRDVIVDEIHYPVEEVNFIYMKLTKGSAIPNGDYKIFFTKNKDRYFESNVELAYMTDTPPEITGMNLKNGMLNVRFFPYAEINTLYQSEFNLKTYKGLDSDGEVIGDDVTSLFNPIMMGDVTKIETEVGITYVTDFSTKIIPGAMLASGKYRLTWTWSADSFFKKIIYDGGLNVYAQDIKSALTYNFNTIQITLNDSTNWKFIKNLDVNVINSKGEDCSDLFRSIIDSNPEIQDSELIDSFFIMVAEDEIVITDTYTFTLSYSVEDDDTAELSTTAAFVFMMNIIYLADEFPIINTIDNLSTKNYNIMELTNANISSYIGRYILPFGEEDKIVLTKENAKEYVNMYAKIYDKAAINKLTIEFDREVEPCLLNALNHMLVDEEGNDVTNKLATISSSNLFTPRDTLSFIEISLKKNVTGLEAGNYTYTISTIDGIDLSEKFKSFYESNPYIEDSNIINKFRLEVDDDEIIESYDTKNLKVIITNEYNDEPIRITGFTTKLGLRDESSTNKAYMNLESNITIPPGNYDIKFSYQNEPTLENAVTIYPFSYSGELPFLSTNIGRISSIKMIDLSHVDITFTEDLPSSIFLGMIIHVYNEDREDFGEKFMPIADSTDLSAGEKLSLLDNPYTITLQLNDETTLPSGNYSFEFEIKLSHNDEDESISSDYYTLWSYVTRLEYMTSETPNTITDVSMIKIDTLKVTLNKYIDSELLRNFSFNLENDSNGFIYGSDTFVKLTDSNNFGHFVLLTDNRYIMTSIDGSSWTRFDTGKEYSLNDVYYDKDLNMCIVVCSGGKIITFTEFTKNSIVEYDTGIKKNLTSIIKVGSAYIVTGNDGTLLRGIYNNNKFVWTKCDSKTTKTITSVTSKSNNELVAVGYSGTVLYSGDNGVTWDVVSIAVSYPEPNLTDVIYSDIQDNEGFYVTGTNGTILYSETGKELYRKIDIETSKSFYSIESHNGNIIAVGDSGVIYKTTDAVNWYSVVSDVSYSLKTITWCDNKYIICSSSGKWLTSISGEYWIQNSSIKSDTLKNAKFLDSQYADNRKINYFYLKLNKNQTIGSIGLYNGTYVPDETNSPAMYWVGGDKKRTHVGDIFTQFAVDGNTSIVVAEYQYTAEKLYDGDDTSTKFSWKECTNINVHRRFSGEYTLYIRLNDSDNTLWNQKDKINLTYMTSTPGSIKKVSIINPTTGNTKSYVDPYIHIDMENADEEAIYYASYELIDSNGVDYTNKFASLHGSDLSYSSSLKINGINIPKNIMNPGFPPANKYTFKWNWTTFDSVTTEFKILNISNLIKSVIRNGIGGLTVTFNKPIQKEYFYKPVHDVNTSKASIMIYKIIDDVIDTSFNYAVYMKPVETTTVFTGATISSIELYINEGNLIPDGNYTLMISNSDKEMVLDDESNMYTLSCNFSLEQELCTELPSISMAKVMNYVRTVEPLVKNKIVKRYTGTTDPSSNSEMNTLHQNWKYNDEEAEHVTDKYTNINTNESYTFIYDKINGIYRWDLDVSNPCLCIAFEDKPVSNTWYRYVNGLSIKDSEGNDVSDYVYSEYRDNFPSNWDFESRVFGDTRYIAKVAIPVNRVQNFYGDSNSSVSLSWKPGCIYDTVQKSEVNLPTVIASYGNIKTITPQMIPYIELHPDTSNDELAKNNKVSRGLSIEFTNPVFVSMLTKANFELIYKSGNNQYIGEDFSSSFLDIRKSNMELFEKNETIDKIYLLLAEEASIPNGIYTLKITMEKPTSDINDDKKVIEFVKDTEKIPWFPYNPPKSISVSYKYKENSPFRMPILKITFNEGMPVYSSCVDGKDKFSIRVIKQDTNVDYTGCFVNPKYSKAIEYIFNEEEPELVESIEIPMHETRVLPVGVYDVFFIFPSYALLEQIPAAGKHKSFTNSKLIVSTCGKVKSIGATDKYKKIKIRVTLHDEINTPQKLKNSQLGKELKVSSFKGLMNKFSLVFTDSNETDFTKCIKKDKGSGKGDAMLYAVKNNNRVDPGSYCAYYTCNGYESIDRHMTDNFKGVIRNVSGKAQNDSICYILFEKLGDNKPNGKMYSTYKALNARIAKMEEINKKHEEQLKKCKKCRASKFLTTSAISAQFDKYRFPENDIGKAMGYILKRYYVNYFSNKKHNNCKKAKIIKIHKAKSKESSYQCENYKKYLQDYSWEVIIANRPKGEKFKKKPKKSTAVYIASFYVNDVRLCRVYSSSKTGKETKKFKSYIKQLEKYVKNHKKQLAKCQKCKKREIANKSGTTITWVSARFMNPIYKNKQFITKINKAFKKGKKGKKDGCKKANFTFVEVDANRHKLNCTKTTKKASFKIDSERGTFIK